ncbi:MAG: acyl-CoA dehydratase activase [bacterium]
MSLDTAPDRRPGTTSLGISIGSSTISCARIGKTNGTVQVLSNSSLPHNGNPKQCVDELLRRYSDDPPESFAVVRRVSFSNHTVPTLTEPEAIEYAYAYVAKDVPPFDAIVSAGGETFMVYLLDRKGHIAKVHSGNKCASGTGEFFLQQIRRINLSIDEATCLAATETNPYKVSGRCSVFCKSDCTHALNKGTAKSRVVAGLCQMMARKISDLLKLSGAKRVLFVGGVAQNGAVADLLRREFPDLVVPKEAPYFEALGAALWSSRRAPSPMATVVQLFPQQDTSFEFFPPLSQHESLITFKDMPHSAACPEDELILGLDVGSTTTKAVLLRLSDHAMVGSVYLRTNGDPVGASRECYRQLAEQVGSTPVHILGLGTTGSGRYIAGLHALTKSIINEITAHAAAARFVDEDVDTVFEIGGQDAKYTYLVNGVATDYAMNEACSAGTGSFLEEAAGEHLRIPVTEIAPLALQATRPLNFSDECAAFIASDINTAIHEGFGREDIVAGIVYSICMNYLNRVKQNRPAGRKILMQGGVCYNRAVPLAMAGLTEQKIIVPPEPGLMGAFGVALEVKRRLELGLLEKESFSLADLASREITYKTPFICKGGKDKCDRRCEVSRIEVEGRVYPFGGACRKYENQRLDKRYDAVKYDHVAIRSERIFDHNHLHISPPTQKKDLPIRIGINKSFTTHIYFPLFSRFFTLLGMQVVLSRAVKEESASKQGSAFCYPMEAAHGSFGDLLDHNPDYYFLPLVKEYPDRGNGTRAHTCVFVRTESACLRASFADQIDSQRILSPVLDFSGGLLSAEAAFLSVARGLGVGASQARAAFQRAVQEQEACFADLRNHGLRILEEIESDPSQLAVVLFGRSYNALTSQLNMGIPHKFASQGIHIIPFDCLPFHNEPHEEEVYWGTGHDILQAAYYVQKHPQLFGVFITNFSCGPDSFILGYFRDIMGSTPSLTLELDSHTADVGIDTRIEAFLDIVRGYRELHRHFPVIQSRNTFVPASIQRDQGILTVKTSNGVLVPITDPRVRVLIPEMGRLNSAGLAAALRRFGIRACVRPTGSVALKRGRECGTCKECLPYQLTTGALIDYLDHHRAEKEVVLFFMPKSHGPCRQGQYTVAVNKLIRKYKLPDVAVFSLDDHSGFNELGSQFTNIVWHVVVISDIFEDIHNVVLALAVDKQQALATVTREYEQILNCIEYGSSASDLRNCLRKSAEILGAIPLTRPLEDAPKVRLLGEVFVRENEFCRQGLVEKLAEKGFVVTVAPLGEYVCYCDYAKQQGYSTDGSGNGSNITTRLRLFSKHWMERKIRKILSHSELVDSDHPRVSQIVTDASHFLNPHMLSESLLSVGLGMHEILDDVCGVISIGPFACMPSRVTEAIFESHMNIRSKRIVGMRKRGEAEEDGLTYLPSLSLEADGRSMSHIAEARLHTFCLQALRVHEYMRNRSGCKPMPPFMQRLTKFAKWNM